MEVILIANEKGGTAKTTTAICLATCLTALGYRTLTVDWDPSGNLSAATLPDFPQKVLYDVYKRNCTIFDAIVHVDGIGDILPTVKDIDTAPDINDFSAVATERKSLSQLADSWTGRRNMEYALKSLLYAPAHGLDEKYDFVIIDTPPSDNILVTNAIVAADAVIVPCEPTSASIDGLNMFIASIMAARSSYDTNVKFDGLLFAKYTEDWQTRRNRIEEILAFAQNHDLRVYKTRFRVSASVETSMNDCKPILNYMYQGNGATDAMNFTLEFLEARGLAPKVTYPGVFKDESGQYTFRKNGDKFYVVEEVDGQRTVKESYFRQDFLKDPQWQAAVGKTIFLSREALNKQYPAL